MYQLDWFDKDEYIRKQIKDNIKTLIDEEDIEAIALTYWCEHCLECARPACYKNCENYKPRKDFHCKLFDFGIHKRDDIAGFLGAGYEIRFRKWGKLESKYLDYVVSLGEYKKVQKRHEKNTEIISKISDIFSVIDKNRYISSGYYYLLNKYYNKKSSLTQIKPNEFIFECYSFEDNPFNLCIESSKTDLNLIYRGSVVINPGINRHTIKVSDLIPEGKQVGLLRIYPENNIEAHLIILSSELIKFKENKKDKKVKCVAWDLDNTLWEGILAENDSNIMPKSGVLDVIKELDCRGIIQTVVSKNTYDIAINVLENLGISEYFLSPAINWGLKSENLKQIAKNLNIDVNSFAVIDDSEFEREEIRTALPQVRVYDDKIITSMLDLEEFNVPVTEESKNRRKMYLVEAERKKIYENFSGEYLDFIKSCNMKIIVSGIINEEIKHRCFELIQRTNQLNMSGNKYTNDEFAVILSNSDRKNYAVSCEDKFGKYGVIAFLSIDIKKFIIEEFAMSCRVAQKHVEYAICSLIARTIENDTLSCHIRVTPKNEPMRNAFSDIGFKEVRRFSKNEFLSSINCREISEDDNIIEIETE